MSDATNKLYARVKPTIEAYLEVVEGMDISVLVPKGPDAKTQFTRVHNSTKKKGGRPPVDYAVAEMIADLRDAVRNERPREAMVLYIQVSRLLPL